MSIEELVLQYCSPHNIHNTKINSIMHNQVTLKINYTNNDFFSDTSNFSPLERYNINPKQNKEIIFDQKSN